MTGRAGNIRDTLGPNGRAGKFRDFSAKYGKLLGELGLKGRARGRYSERSGVEGRRKRILGTIGKAIPQQRSTIRYQLGFVATRPLHLWQLGFVATRPCGNTPLWQHALVATRLCGNSVCGNSVLWQVALVKWHLWQLGFCGK